MNQRPDQNDTHGILQIFQMHRLYTRNDRKPRLYRDQSAWLTQVFVRHSKHLLFHRNRFHLVPSSFRQTLSIPLPSVPILRLPMCKSQVYRLVCDIIQERKLNHGAGK